MLTYKLSSGERLPVLLHNGLPQYWPTLWVSAKRRKCRVAARTLALDLRSVMLVLEWAEEEGFSLEARLLAGRYLTDTEVTAISDRCDRRHGGNVISLRTVINHTYSMRMTRIREYVDWIAGIGMGNLSSAGRSYADCAEARTHMKEAFTSRQQIPRRRKTLHAREGLSTAVLDRLVTVVSPDCPENPWSTRSIKIRNQALVILTLTLGLRRGELLGLRVNDVDFGAHRLLVARRADDAEDPRIDQPTAKTNDRMLLLEPAVAEILRYYILEVRRLTPNAKRHPHLFVGHKPGRNEGRPLALVSVNALYQGIRKKVTGLPSDLTSHVLRHTWNDKFSELCTKAKTTDEKEKAIRNYLMGWSPTSETAAVYTRRHVRAEAEELSLKHQRRVLASAGLEPDTESTDEPPQSHVTANPETGAYLVQTSNATQTKGDSVGRDGEKS